MYDIVGTKSGYQAAEDKNPMAYQGRKESKMINMGTVVFRRTISETREDERRRMFKLAEDVVTAALMQTYRCSCFNEDYVRGIARHYLNEAVAKANSL